jgi:mRNA-degrading endonuclease toxin of MazEF toxin-antitoxin module
MRERYENLVAAFCYRIQQMPEARSEEDKAPPALVLLAKDWNCRPLAVLAHPVCSSSGYLKLVKGHLLVSGTPAPACTIR